MISGTKPVFFQWSKNGINLTNRSDLRFRIETFKDYSQFGIETVDRSDSGNYSCIARNAFGTDIQSALLIVKGLIQLLKFDYFYPHFRLIYIF
jgi:hypothetical protein